MVVFGALHDAAVRYRYTAAKVAPTPRPLPIHVGLALGTFKSSDEMAMTFKRLSMCSNQSVIYVSIP